MSGPIAFILAMMISAAVAVGDADFSGIIEEAEGFSLADIQYHKDANTRRLYPLERAYEDDTTKSSPYGTPNLILKGGLA